MPNRCAEGAETIEELKQLAEHVARARAEIADEGDSDLSAVVENTERATEAIMVEAERVMALDARADAAAYKSAVDGAMTRVIEACAFQDITGQRLARVVATLERVEQRIDRLATRRAGEENVDEVDAPLDGQARAGLDQRDIDTLFD